MSDKFIRIKGCYECPHSRAKIIKDYVPDGWYRTECGIAQNPEGGFMACQPLKIDSEAEPPPSWCPLEPSQTRLSELEAELEKQKILNLLGSFGAESISKIKAEGISGCKSIIHDMYYDSELSKEQFNRLISGIDKKYPTTLNHEVDSNDN